MSRKLRVGILTSSLQLRAWQSALLHRIANSSYAELSLVALVDGFASDAGAFLQGEHGVSGTRWVRLLLEGAGKLLERRAILKRDAFEIRNGSEIPGRVRTIGVSVLKESPAYEISVQDLARLKEHHIDVFVDLSGVPLSGGILSAATYGVWSVHYGDERFAYCECPSFWEVFLQSPVTASCVRMAADAARAPTVLCRSFSSTDPISVKRNNNNLYWKSVSMVARELRALQRMGEGSFFSRAGRDDSQPLFSGEPGPRPTEWQVAIHIAKMFKREFRYKLRNYLTVPQWILLFRFETALSTRVDGFQKILPPKDRFWADPHVVFRGGRHWIFFEECLFGSAKGHIAVLAIDQDGSFDTPVKVLERPYHLSYPFIFEDGDELFMIPETSDNRTVELYRCVEFPAKWEFVQNLLEDVGAFDATLVQHDGKWWLFANLVETPGASSWDELFLFHSDSVVDGQWTPHPLNPIVSDVRRARPAGSVFRKNGKLYRPAQDCSVRYGYATRIHHIIKLSEDDYAETEVAAIEPNWDKKIVATHTLNHAGGLTVIDALQHRFRF